MARCATCGNDYERSFEIIDAGGRRFSFDSFECAVQQMALACSHCGCRLLGHGVEAEDGKVYCCAHCARAGGETRAVDNTAAAGA